MDKYKIINIIIIIFIVLGSKTTNRFRGGTMNGSALDFLSKPEGSIKTWGLTSPGWG